MKKLVYGVGVNDHHSTTIDSNGKHYNFYNAWVNMLMRCYSKSYQLDFPTYTGCTVCDEWHSLTAFKQWHDLNYVNGYDLDKDLLVPGNKVYSPNTCAYVPKPLNYLLLDRSRFRGAYPMGVSYDKSRGKFLSIVTIDGKAKNCGRFNTVHDAEQAYKKAKNAEILRKVNQYTGTVDRRVLYSLTRIAYGLLQEIE